MNGVARVNPLKQDALTVDSPELQPGMVIKFWRPGEQSSVREGVTVLSVPHLDNDEDLVILLRFADGREETYCTSSVGLSGDRTTGEWYAIAILDDSED